MLKGEYRYGTDNLSEAFNIRKTVFGKEFNFLEEELFDDFELDSIHVLIYYKDIAIGTGRLYYSGESYKIGRIAVLKEYRKNGIGEFLVNMLIDKALLLGADEVIVHSQERAVDFYKKLGFHTIDNIPFKEFNIPHIKMIYYKKNNNKCKS
ncbi:putative GNAT family N-acyltransferase [Natranaerovirga pectinivora]|uniref:Putative GNAT family N-acyltransferase n=1 Tax=Natranaerovirga pectinivora TaxID=682400 RepID=A0A4R3MGK6_9FIRM|nr:GNAT family N-acetyltransferase [Natranaerovirga pectinivora]TCT12250.1 putative GNAT family N-acyltransferase [Natranaerovirga pectinivora]